MLEFPGVDLDVLFRRIKNDGGDGYDIIPVGDTEHIAFAVSTGIRGALLLRLAVNNFSASDVLSRANCEIARDIKPGLFVTCMYAIMNLRTREMTIASA